MKFLLPLAWIYAAVMAVRNRLFDRGALRSAAFPLPVISVGNLAVGGTGKTPHTEYLLRLLSREGFRCAMLSRGYGRTTKGFREVAGGQPSETGDEPFQVQQKFPEVRVCVCEKRPEGIRRILETETRPEVIVLDDAYQHRYVTPSLSILLTDYALPYSRDHVLPAGRLRESRSGARRADVIIVTKCPPALSETERERLRSELRPEARQHVFFTRMRYASLRPLFPEAETLCTHLSEGNKKTLLLCGIANPRPLAAHIAAKHGQPDVAEFSDHHSFTADELRRIAKRAEHYEAVITTEKDAVRLAAMSIPDTLRRRLLVQPIEVEFLTTEEKITFNQIIISHVAENQRNSRVD